MKRLDDLLVGMTYQEGESNLYFLSTTLKKENSMGRIKI